MAYESMFFCFVFPSIKQQANLFALPNSERTMGELQDCKLYLPTASNPQYWIVNTFLGEDGRGIQPAMAASDNRDEVFEKKTCYF